MKTAKYKVMKNVQCECGEWSGEKCQWEGPKHQTVRVEFMPEWLRGSHAAAGNSGDYPHNGAIRITVSRECAYFMCVDTGIKEE